MAVQKTRKADVKSKTRRYFEFSLMAALLLIIAAFRFFPDVEVAANIAEANTEVIKIDDVAITKQFNKPPPPPRPAIPIEAPTDEAMPDIEIGELNLDDDLTAPTGPPADVAPPEDANEDPTWFEVVEDYPEIVGGMKSVYERLEYPALARRAGIEGKVVIFAYVDATGKVVATEVVKGIGGGCDEAAAKAIIESQWVPGKQRGVPVPVKTSITITFRLTN
ncbi:MAG: energy transducer TonB [Ectothiorhodospiraceae bacterium]|nr:energy transducer TonB [Ectothiorhodospiraceae bacterium]